MLYIHENNIQNKIHSDYKGKGKKIEKFMQDSYLPFKTSMEKLNFKNVSLKIFEGAANEINAYYNKLQRFAQENNITSQSKFESTLLEEISVYLFKDIQEIRDKKLEVFNKGIYAGLKFNPDLTIDIVKKDVDFCIGKKVNIKIENQNPVTLTLPLVSVEVKTYLDATMFGEIKSSSKTLKSATPNSKAYVLIGHKELADEHIIAARQDSTLDEIFVLRKDSDSPIDPYALYIYWMEITEAIKNITSRNELKVPGRLLAYNDLYENLKKSSN